MAKGLDFKGLEEFQAMGKANMDAVLASAAVWTEGWQAIAAECADYARASLETSLKAVETAVNVRSVEAAIEAQGAYARDAYDGFLSETGKLGGMVMSVARDALAPIEKRVRDAA